MASQLEGGSLYRLMSVSCALAFTMYGYDAGVLGGLQQTKPFLHAMGNPTGTYIIPMIASSYILAAAVSSLTVPPILGMRLGRRRMILVGNVSTIIGATLQASAWSIPHMIVGRIFCGFGIGLIASTVPTYMMEMSITEKQRGPEVSIQCMWLISGVALAYWIDLAFTRMSNQASWRIPIGCQMIFAILSGGCMLLLPDTPRWYYARQKLTEGDAVLSKLHAKPLEHPDVQHQRNEILATISLEEEKDNSFSPLDLLWDRSDLRIGTRIRVSFLLLAVQQMMGIQIAVFYSTLIFARLGLSPFLSQVLAAVMNTCFALGTVPLPWTVERFGRRGIMLWGAVASMFCITLFTAMIAVPHQTKATQWTAVASIIAYNFVFGYAWVGVPWLYGPEIAPLKYRHISAAAGAFGELFFAFIVIFGGGIAIQNVGWPAWLWQILSCAFAVPLIYFYCPETTGKTLEEIDILFAKREVRERLRHEIETKEQVLEKEHVLSKNAHGLEIEVVAV